MIWNGTFEKKGLMLKWDKIIQCGTKYKYGTKIMWDKMFGIWRQQECGMWCVWRMEDRYCGGWNILDTVRVGISWKF